MKIGKVYDIPEMDEHWKLLEEHETHLIFKLYKVGGVEIIENVQIEYDKGDFILYLYEQFENYKKGIKPVLQYHHR